MSTQANISKESKAARVDAFVAAMAGGDAYAVTTNLSSLRYHYGREEEHKGVEQDALQMVVKTVGILENIRKAELYPNEYRDLLFYQQILDDKNITDDQKQLVVHTIYGNIEDYLNSGQNQAVLKNPEVELRRIMMMESVHRHQGKADGSFPGNAQNYLKERATSIFGKLRGLVEGAH